MKILVMQFSPVSYHYPLGTHFPQFFLHVRFFPQDERPYWKPKCQQRWMESDSSPDSWIRSSLQTYTCKPMAKWQPVDTRNTGYAPSVTFMERAGHNHKK